MRLTLIAIVLIRTSISLASGCDSGANVRGSLAKWRESQRKLTFSERRQSLDDLAAKYADSFEVQAERLSWYRWNLPDAWPALQQSYVKRAEQNSGDPLALTLAASALHRTNTPQAIEWLGKAIKIAPGYPWATLKLAEIHQSGKFEDQEKARANFEKFANACGERLPRSAEWVMGKVATTGTQAAIAKAMRARLERETDLDGLLDYESLWALEFRTTPPQEHAALRKQVASDVARLEKLNPKPDSRWMAMLLSGVKQSGASKEAVTAFEERVLKEAPTSYPAYSVTYDRWKKEHKEPEDHKDSAAWEAWSKAYRTAMKQWAAQFTEAEWLESSYISAAIDAGEMSEKEAVAAVAESLRKELQRSGPSLWTYMEAAGKLVKKGWAPKKALEWTERAWPLAEAEDRRRLEDDTLTDERRKELTEGSGYRDHVARTYLRALQLAGRKECPQLLRAYVEGPLPAKKSDHAERYWAMARLAAIDGRNADALTFYQAALFHREKPPRHWRGKLEDELLDEARATFIKAGGSEKAFALWSKPAGTKQELAEGRWEKPKKTLPAFELADLSGKTWKLKQLEGKALLINLWATWCGPCKAELPHLQKLYEKTRERSEVQVISFNVDEELGLVEPFVQEHSFTFPVLPAYGLVRGLFDGYGIPQNWLVDPKGNWIATQLGFDASDMDWVNSMTKRLEDARQGKPPSGMIE